MASLLSTSRTLLRPTASFKTTTTTQQVRHATLLQRPHRPYTFTQLIALSDGSTFTVRTTSPAPIHRSTQDSRNTALWQPSMDSLKNIEKDEAGRLRAFRDRYGRGWDATEGHEEKEVKMDGEEKGDEKVGKDGKKVAAKVVVEEEGEDSLFDLISGAASRKP